MLRSSDGAKHLILPMMFLGLPDGDALASLARLPGAAFELRGKANVAEPANFSPAQCTFIYRTAP